MDDAHVGRNGIPPGQARLGWSECHSNLRMRFHLAERGILTVSLSREIPPSDRNDNVRFTIPEGRKPSKMSNQTWRLC